MRNLIFASIFVWLTGSVLGYTVFIPQVAHGPHWKTTVRILNFSAESIDVPALFFRADGEPWTTHGFIERFGTVINPDSQGHIPFGVNAWAVLDVTTSLLYGIPDDGIDKTGYLVFQVKETLRGKISITAFLTYYPDGKQPGSQVGLFPSDLYTNINFPVDIETAICLTNPSSDRLRIWVALSMVDPSGNRKVHNGEVMLEPRQQRALFLREIIKPEAGLKDLDYFGWVQFYTEDGAVTFAGLPLVFRSSGLMTSIPMLGYDQAW